MKKKFIALLLAVLMLLSVAGCNASKSETTSQPTESTTQGSSSTVSSSKETTTQSSEETTTETKEPVTITFRYTNFAGEQQYTDQVEEKLNEILKTIKGYENISIDLIPGTSNYPTEFTLAQANGDPIDIFNTFMLDVPTLVKDGDIMPMDDLMAQCPDLTAELPDWLIRYGQVNGTQYYIPTYQQAAKTAFLWTSQEYLDMYYTASGTTREDVAHTLQEGSIEDKLDMYEAMALAIRKGTGLNTKYIEVNPYPMYWFNTDDCYEDNGNIIMPEGGDKVVYWPMTKEYETIMRRYNEWFKSGLAVAAKTLKGATNGDSYSEPNSMIFRFDTNPVPEDAMAETVSTDSVKCDAIRNTSHAYIPSIYAAGGNAIYTDCKHPVEAMKIIDLLMTEKGTEFYNTLCWGLEGIHWEWVDKSVPRIKTLEFDDTQGGPDTTYCAWNWNTGNTFNCWLNQASPRDDAHTYIKNVINEGPDTTVSPYNGITWDYSSVANQIAQCKAVDDEFYNTLYMADDFDAQYEQYLTKLKAAGVQDILDCANKTCQDFLASK